MNITVTHSNRYYYLKDHVGNIRVTVNEFGQAEAYNDYYPFGLQMPGRSVNNAMTDDIYKFGGKELDEESGLNWYYFGARYYDPATGRWMSVDPLADFYPSWSPYNYSMNDPIGKRDPNGRSVWGAVIGAAVEYGLQVYETGNYMPTSEGWAKIGVSAAAGLASGGLSTFAKGSRIAQVAISAGVSASEGAAKKLISGEQVTAGGVIIDAVAGGVASKAGDAVDNVLTKQVQKAGDAGEIAGQAAKKLQGTRTNSKTSRATYKKNAANATTVNSNFQKAAKKANTAMTLENVGASNAASSTTGVTASSAARIIDKEEKEK
ncbi:MAG: RHS repeat-associated core domain-containing protein [Calditrichaceae bacterium]